MAQLPPIRQGSFDHHSEEMWDMLAKIDVMTPARFVLLVGRQLPQWDRDCIVEGREGLFRNALSNTVPTSLSKYVPISFNKL